jgi:hypothetical protein
MWACPRPTSLTSALWWVAPAPGACEYGFRDIYTFLPLQAPEIAGRHACGCTQSGSAAACRLQLAGEHWSSSPSRCVLQGVSSNVNATRRLLQGAADNVTVYYDVGGVPEADINSLPDTLNTTSTVNTFRQLLVANGTAAEPSVYQPILRGRLPASSLWRPYLGGNRSCCSGSTCPCSALAAKPGCCAA